MSQTTFMQLTDLWYELAKWHLRYLAHLKRHKIENEMFSLIKC